MSAVLDALAFSSLIAAGVAGALACAASQALGVPVSPPVVWLAASGTLVVYSIDRLRDIERDREAWPARTAFVERNRGRLRGLVAGAAVASGAAALSLNARAWALCGVALALGLLHRRLKANRVVKTSYQAAAWLAVVVGLPLIAGEARSGPETLAIVLVALVLGLTLVANFFASDLDAPGHVREIAAPDARVVRGQRRSLRAALLLCAAAACIAIAGPGPQRTLALVPVAEGVALLFYRAHERYELVVVDGALALAGVAVWAIA